MEPFIMTIRTSEGVSGIQVGKVEHKIGLYVDDVLLILSDPLLSLPAVSHIIQEFGRLSLYEVNSAKSQMSGIISVYLMPFVIKFLPTQPSPGHQMTASLT